MWLGALDEEISESALNQPSIGDVLLPLQDKLEFRSTERDMVLMGHDFEVTYKDGRNDERKSSLLLDYGDPNGTVHGTDGGANDCNWCTADSR